MSLTSNQRRHANVYMTKAFNVVTIPHEVEIGSSRMARVIGTIGASTKNPYRVKITKARAKELAKARKGLPVG